MDKRTVLALFLIVGVILAGWIIQPRLNPPVADSVLPDSTPVAVTPPASAATPAPAANRDSVKQPPALSATTTPATP